MKRGHVHFIGILPYSKADAIAHPCAYVRYIRMGACFCRKHVHYAGVAALLHPPWPLPQTPQCVWPGSLGAAAARQAWPCRSLPLSFCIPECVACQPVQIFLVLPQQLAHGTQALHKAGVQVILNVGDKVEAYPVPAGVPLKVGAVGAVAQAVICCVFLYFAFWPRAAGVLYRAGSMPMSPFRPLPRMRCSIMLSA